MTINIKKEIKRVLDIQIQNLRGIKKQIGSPYVQAANVLFNCKGKVIITGIGKSGLIAEKIASTLSSTGTPAIFLHPVEGMHGNLGVVHKNDVVLAIGKSGESEEVLNILPSIRKIGAKVICLTANKQSSLAKQSSIVLHTPINREACPLNLAPTTSTTAALVIGDALAIALMKLRGFNQEMFALYHPGGLLGKKLLLKVSDVMRTGKQNPVVRLKDGINKVLSEISRKWTGATSVIDGEGRLMGVVTDFDIREVIMKKKDLTKVTAKEIMNPRPTFILETEMATKALNMMEARNKPLTILPVVNHKKKVVGMVHIHDLINKGFTS